MLINSAGKTIRAVTQHSLHAFVAHGAPGWGRRCNPIPIKDRKASVKIAGGTAKVSVTKITPTVLGRMWRKMM